MAARKKEENMSDDALREFILKNEDRILEILSERKAAQEGCPDRAAGIRAEAEKGKAFVKGVAEAMTDRQVTEHFMSMGVEFMLGIGALVKALPWPEEMRSFVDTVSEQNEALSSVMCQRNPHCRTAAAGSAKKLERIELD